MAQERSLTKVENTSELDDTELTKKELHDRMEQARDSISQTVTEIKETMTNKVEEIGRTLDWREHVKERPMAFTLGALATGFVAGVYLVDMNEPKRGSYKRNSTASSESSPAYSLAASSGTTKSKPKRVKEGPGLLEKMMESSAFQHLQVEAKKIGDHLVDEMVAIGTGVLLPAVVSKVREAVSEIVPAEKSSTPRRVSASTGVKSTKADSAQKPDAVSTDDKSKTRTKTSP